MTDHLWQFIVTGQVSDEDAHGVETLHQVYAFNPCDQAAKT